MLDYDAHHGNGTQAAFIDDPRVLFVSLHQWPLYPGTGRATETGTGAGVGTTMNVPLPPGATGDVYLQAFDEVIAPVVERFAPTWLLISAGFDAHRDDPLTELGLTAGDYPLLTARALQLVPPGRCVAMLEGGYDLDALAGVRQLGAGDARRRGGADDRGARAAAARARRPSPTSPRSWHQRLIAPVVRRVPPRSLRPAWSPPASPPSSPSWRRWPSASPRPATGCTSSAARCATCWSAATAPAGDRDLTTDARPAEIKAAAARLGRRGVDPGRAVRHDRRPP